MHVLGREFKVAFYILLLLDKILPGAPFCVFVYMIYFESLVTFDINLKKREKRRKLEEMGKRREIRGNGITKTKCGGSTPPP